jgi:TolA-binding protein
VQDKTYYVGELRRKFEEIVGETSRMQGEIEQCQRDGQTRAQLEKRWGGVVFLFADARLGTRG